MSSVDYWEPEDQVCGQEEGVVTTFEAKKCQLQRPLPLPYHAYDRWVRMAGEPDAESSRCATGNFDRYCLVDNNDGTGHVVSAKCTESDRFPIGYDPRIITIPSEEFKDTVLVDNGENKYYRIVPNNISRQGGVSDVLWKDLPRILVPYDIDLTIDDGCHGTDWFFQDDPLPLYVAGGILHVADCLVTPDFITSSARGGQTTTSEVFRIDKMSGMRSIVEDVLYCAASEARDPIIYEQLQSAIAMVNSGQQENIVMTKGPHQFRYASFNISFHSGDLSVHSIRGEDGTIASLKVTVRPNGLFNDTQFAINRLGLIYRYNSNCKREFCCTSHITLKKFNDAERRTIIEFLQSAIPFVDGEGNKETVRQIARIVESPGSL
jgi:hypothetical protein